MSQRGKLPDTETVYREYQGGESIQSLAQRYGVHYETVRRLFKRAQLPVRTLSESHKLAYRSERRTPQAKSGAQHWAWKGGKERRGYRRKIVKESCATCQAVENLCVHHVDFDHYNNHPDNLQVLCLSCHLSLHKTQYWKSLKQGEAPKRSNAPVGWTRQ